MTDRVAIFPWGDVIETFLDPLGLTARDFADAMSGGWLFGYVAALQSAGIEAVVIAPSAAVAAPTRLVHAETGAAIVLVPGRRIAWRQPDLAAIARWRAEPVRAFARVLRDERIDAILCQEYEDPRFDRLVRLGRRLGLPVFASFQGGDRTGSRVERLIRERSIAASRGLIVPARRERARLAARYRTLPPIATIANPLAAGRWADADRATARAALGLAQDGRIAICHGRISIHRKGLDVLLDAWRRLAPGPDERLVVIGSGEDDRAFGALVADTAQVRWIARYTTDQAELRQWLTAADVYVSASRIEGMPVAPLEAMACGLPVVVSDANGMEDIVLGGPAPCGLVVPRDDPDALAAALARLLRQPHRLFAHAARDRIATAFSIDGVGRALSAFLAMGTTQDGS